MASGGLSRSGGRRRDEQAAIRRFRITLAVAASLGGVPAWAQVRTHPTGRPVSVELFFVAVSPTKVQGETFGCGDVLVSRQRTEPFVGSTLESASREATAAPPKGLVNSVAALHIELRLVTIDDRDATVTLEPFSIGGACDNPRIEEQLTRVVDQFGAFHRIDIMVGDCTLAQYLSLK